MDERPLDGVGPEVVDRAARIRLVLMDVDGVLTDGRIQLDGDGRETKAFDVRDGHGIRMGQQAGLLFGILSGREAGAVVRRAEELGIDELHQGVDDKGSRLQEILERRGVDARAACFIGDDLIDLPAMRRCGLAVAPADAVPAALAAAHHVTRRGGGRGAVRELIELLLHASGRWDRVTGRWTAQGET